jgi:tyrosine-protein kinase Etk/Wzc
MNEEFEIRDLQSMFDFKGFLLKLISYWPLFLISLVIAFSIAYYVNVRKLAIYQIENMISIKDDQNPFFTTNTSLTFNWGGTTDKVNTSIITLRSRSHAEKVVDRLQYYLTYLKDGKYQKIDAYGKTPFWVKVDTLKPQVLEMPIKVMFLDSVSFTLQLLNETNGNFAHQIYSAEKNIVYSPEAIGKESRAFKIGEPINLSFFNGTFLPNPEVKFTKKMPFYLQFVNFNGTVRQFMNVNVEPESKGSSVLQMRLRGQNKRRLVDYLNASVAVLSDNMLERKNLFATKTIRFIDSSLAQKTEELKGVEEELNRFKNQNSIVDLESEGKEITLRLNNLDLRKEGIEQELNYFNTLETYLVSRSDYRDVPAPSVAGISETSIVSGVAQIVEKAKQRNTMEYSYKEDAPIFKDIDRQIDAIKKVLLENISSSKGLKNQELRRINNDIAGYENEIRRLPKEQQELLKIERRYNLSQNTYNLFLAKRGEAGLVKAANVSDVLVIDPAKDTGGGKVGPNTQLNYVMATLFGLFVPFLIVFLKVNFDTRIQNSKEIERLSKIPILGVIGKSWLENNLAVIDKPKSAISESFRAIRSSLQFFYKKQGVQGTKTVLITSSISGEGKTFCSINVASVFALSEKKTVLIGLDLRKPKIFDDFQINNEIGVVNYLIGDASLDGIIQKTMIDTLDVITAGPIPPNPSELLMSDRMSGMIEQLKDRYDYIVLDSPPLGLVADSLELLKYADATIYMIRQNYTKKGMLNMINEKYKTGEVKHISFVLNFFESKAKYGYGYGYGYGNGYGYGYGYGQGYGQGYHEEIKKPTLLNRLQKKLRKKKRR